METIIGRRAYLLYDTFVADNTPGGRWDEGFTGWFNRSAGVGDTLETFLEFDVSPFFGQSASTVAMEFDFGVQGTQAVAQPFQVYEQDKASSNVWLSNNRSPWFDDIPITTWANNKLLGNGTYQPVNYPPTETLTLQASRLLNLVNDWLAGSTTWRDGVVLTSNTSTKDWWTEVLAVRLIIDGLVAAPKVGHTTYRGIRNGISNGIL